MPKEMSVAINLKIDEENVKALQTAASDNGMEVAEWLAAAMKDGIGTNNIGLASIKIIVMGIDMSVSIYNGASAPRVLYEER